MKLIKKIKRFIYDKYCILRYGEIFVSLEEARGFYNSKKNELTKDTADLVSDILWPKTKLEEYVDLGKKIIWGRRYGVLSEEEDDRILERMDDLYWEMPSKHQEMAECRLNKRRKR